MTALAIDMMKLFLCTKDQRKGSKEIKVKSRESLKSHGTLSEIHNTEMAAKLLKFKTSNVYMS